jgi:hypothetical protein
MARLCSQTACSRPAAATMTYGYTARTAWLDELEDDRTPAGYDLCADHADRLRVPQGWELADRRHAAQPLFSRTTA